MLGSKSGRIFTFYSYKGGTGRTMAAANMAWVLASNGYRVLLIDWDLESPGLHRYLRPFLADPDLTRTAGLIDFFSSAKPQALHDFIVPVKWTFSAGGSLDFLAAGQQDKNYPQRVNMFNWAEFYDRRGGNRLIHEMRDTLKARYDYVLIDSRTGISDTLDICTMQMPDLLVVLFTLNHQSIEGSAAIAGSIQAQRPELPIFPVPTRVEYGEQDKLSAALTFARRMFAPFLLHVQSGRLSIDFDQQAQYWRDVETPYVAYYAFEEVPAAFKDEVGSRRGLLAASERLSSWITDREVSSLKLGDQENRRSIIAAFAFSKDRAPIFDWRVSARKSPFAGLPSIMHRLVRYRWQVATIVLAAAVIVMLALFWYTRPPKLQIQPVPQIPNKSLEENMTEPAPSPRRKSVTEPSHQDSEPPSHPRE